MLTEHKQFSIYIYKIQCFNGLQKKQNNGKKLQKTPRKRSLKETPYE